MLVPPAAEAAEVARSERNQGRAPDMGVVEHGRLGFNYRLTDLAAALGVAQLERLDELLAARARVAAAYASDSPLSARQSRAIPSSPCPRRPGAERRSWFVYVVQLPRAPTATR